jgi:hypothetical protein
MSSPTSTPGKILSNKERKLKLRASCDSCAASKVKCSKEHPTCARCSANGSSCIYGISRKHGKPGRTRKRNADGTPFVKVSKQRPSPDGREFGKFRIQPERILPNTPDFEIASNWASDWSSTPSLPATPKFDFETAPEPFHLNTNTSDFAFLDNTLIPTAQLHSEPVHTVEHEFTFRDPFAKTQSVHLGFPELQALQDYIGGDVVNPMDYTFSSATTADPFQAFSPSSTPHSPKSQPMNSFDTIPMHASISMPTTHCCYSLAYSTLESLKTIGANATATHTYSVLTQEAFNSFLSITRLAVESVLQLLSCTCSSDPHLAMLYSSITSKILAWYQIVAGVNITTSSGALMPSSSLERSYYSSSPSSSGFSSPLSTLGGVEEMSSNAQLQSIQFEMYEFDEQEQQRKRRLAVLGELNKCEQLIEALANWRGNGSACEQAEFLFDILGAWLKSELYKTRREVEAADTL